MTSGEAALCRHLLQQQLPGSRRPQQQQHQAQQAPV
jgi:hypothetical protein